MQPPRSPPQRLYRLWAQLLTLVSYFNRNPNAHPNPAAHLGFGLSEGLLGEGSRDVVLPVLDRHLQGATHDGQLHIGVAVQG